ncbi:MAG TPA: glycoside hydrolase family 2 protein, partial [Lachnospiraceae bacterium]|nr:glycoside hydrolase family 2 protein [Lachnospiraceae bacterium]
IAGGFGWCMFDYNTHQDFGSGDLICYHGVLDMFRNPKLAAAVYASQGTRQNILEISSNMSIGEYPSGNIGTVYAFTNADCVRLYKNDQFVKAFYPDRKHFPHMPHPPVAIDDFIGELMEKGEGYDTKTAAAVTEVLFAVAKFGQNNLPFKYKIKMMKVIMRGRLKLEDGLRLYYKYVGNWGGKVTSYRFEAIRNGAVVKTVIKEPAEQLVLEAKVSSHTLYDKGTCDAAAVRLRMLDQNGNLLSYYQEPLRLSTEGPLRLLGPSVISLKGGMGGVYVRTTGTEGTGSLTIEGEQIQPKTLQFEVITTGPNDSGLCKIKK